MKRLKGPELKMPELRAPAFLVDLFHDLRDRRLLPLIGLILVAIVSVPFLLGGDSEEEAIAPPAGAGVIEALKSEANASSFTVVEAKPGLRDYRRRLRGRRPTDPFEQRFTGPALKGADLPESKGKESSGSEPKSSESTTTVTPEGDSATGNETTDGGGGASPGDPGSAGNGHKGGGEPPITLYSFAVDVRIVRTTGSDADGTKQTSEPTIERRVLPTTSLPGEKTEVVTYVGISPKTKKPTFLVSTDVTAMFGEGKCAAGTDVCQLVELEPGFPQTFVYGDAGARYKIKVLDVEPVASGRY